MNCLIGAVVLLISITAEARVGNSNESTSYCTETKECLLFDLICEGDDYEVRHYEAAKWVTTEVESIVKEVAIVKAFRKLFKYITGENEAGAHIDMTAPVITKIKEETPWLETSVYVLSFLLPSAYQSQAPQPNDSTVYFTDMPDMKVYVKSFGGWMVSPITTMYSDQLKKALDKAQATYETDYHYDVGYNSPMKLLKRHNEVWYVVKGQPVCPPAE
ncbi:heme-binding protein 2 [Clarias gariepinus]|uniref:heme-binding protein 2 n=1 Tax=Clarias gariepinus TaxID=13013 RepID=UPI00234C61E6|nr:heme-binding protein 2 [Clarias gariepinus]